ncbi:hypothetical protein GCM10010420_07760 [Streptomyces glaucosporus]|uniref:Uncharacterized protein n=1 Tax=Streptomyces glaucosporus TaxID=284044 RepID=A0ABN3HTN3_9ACTN
MRHDDDHEPVFVRSEWGTNRYVYNPDSPVGMTFIVLSLALVVLFFFHVSDSSSWTEDELRDAVHEATGVLAEEPHPFPSRLEPSEWVADRIEEAVHEAGGVNAAPGPRVEYVEEAGRYEVTATDTTAVFCLRVEWSPFISEEDAEPDPYEYGGAPGDSFDPRYTLRTTVAEDYC